MLIAILKDIFYWFYPLEAGELLNVVGEQRNTFENTRNNATTPNPRKINTPSDNLRRTQRLARSIQQTKKSITTNATTTNTKWVVPMVRTTLLKAGSAKIKKSRCQGCGLDLSDDQKSLRYQQRKISGLCLACKMMLKFAKNDELIRRFKRSKKRKTHTRHHEVKFKKYLHKTQGRKNSIFSKVELYHLPLSPHYYRKLDKRTIHHSSYPRNNTLAHFITCTGCRLFVSTRRKSLVHATQLSRNRRGYDFKEGSDVASFHDLFKIMVSSNSSCVFSGQKGIWHSSSGCPEYPLYSLSLDHKVPLSKGGLSTIDNLQVSLACLNNVKGSHSNKEFAKWWNAFKRKQGCL